MTEVNNICDQLFSFFLNECSPEVSDAFKEHLSKCPACRAELADLQQAWETLPYEMELVEVPESQRVQIFEQIMVNIHQQAAAAPARTEMKSPNGQESVEPLQPAVQKPRSRWSFAAAAVLYIAIGAALGWGLKDYGDSKPQNPPIAAGPMAEPAQLVSLYNLKAFDPGMPEATGKCFVKQKGETKQLVLQVNGLKSNSGEWAYQVWLIKEGVRYNGGTFRVNDKGDGVLTYDLAGAVSSFEAVGITLEPDTQGTKPRGKKVLGT